MSRRRLWTKGIASLALASLLVTGITLLSGHMTGAFLTNLGHVGLVKVLVNQGARGEQEADSLRVAEWLFLTAQALDGGDARLDYSLGHVFLAWHEPKRAIEMFLNVTHRDPTNRLAHFRLGELYLSLGREDEATAEYRCAGAAQAMSLRFYKEGVQSSQRGDVKGAEALFLLAVKVDPTSAEAYYALGQLYWTREREKAIKAFTRVVALESETSVWKYLAQGRVFILKQDWNQAVGPLQTAVAIEPELGEARYMLGLALDRTGDWEQAARQLQKATEVEPDNVWSWLFLSQFYFGHGVLDKALATLQECARLHPAVPIVYDRLASVFQEQGRIAEAIAQLRIASRLEPNNETYHVRLGDLYMRSGEIEAAADQYRQALRLNPDNQYAEERLREVEQDVQP